MKKLLLLAPLLAVAGCSSLALVNTARQEPVFRAAVQAGATKQSVIAAAGNPNSMYQVINGNGMCANYVFNKNGAPFYVVFNKQDRVTSYGFESCADADAKAILRSDQPLQEIY